MSFSQTEWVGPVVEIFGKVVMWGCLAGLAGLVLMLVDVWLHGRCGRTARRMLDAFRRLPLAAQIVVAAFVLTLIVHGSTKPTNGVPPAASAPTRIGYRAFWNCDGLTEPSFGLDLDEIGGYAFEYCDGFSDIVCSDGLRVIGGGAFANCSNLKTLTFNLGLSDTGSTEIGDQAFAGCGNLSMVVLPTTLKRIGRSAFYNCTSLDTVVFSGAVPTLGNSDVFYGVPSDAVGYYAQSERDAWLATIPSEGNSKGVWQRLHMHEIAQPMLRIKTASPTDGSVTLQWDMQADYACRYEIYRSSTLDFNDAENIATTTSFEYTDGDFATIEPEMSPLWYWIKVVPDQPNPLLDTMISLSHGVRTRTRYGVLVGYNCYEMDELVVGDDGQTLDYISLAYSLMTSCGGFETENMYLLANATTDDLACAFAEIADIAVPGDLVVFNIGSYGGYTESGESLYAFYDRMLSVGEMGDMINVLPTNVNIVGNLMAYTFEKSGGLVKDLSRICGENMVVISSSMCTNDAFILGGDYSQFEKYFLSDGWKYGCADRELYHTDILGGNKDYPGGNGDGVLTFNELLQYTKVFEMGAANEIETRYIGNSKLLDIVAGVGYSVPDVHGTSRLATPLNFKVEYDDSQSNETHTLKFSWDKILGAERYWLYELKNDGTRELMATTTSPMYEKESDAINKDVDYLVYAQNKCGFSDYAISGDVFAYLFKDWLTTSYPDLLESAGGHSDSLIDVMSANGMNTIGDCYTAGLDPTNETSRFTAKIEIDVNGVPRISWEPDLNRDGTKRRAYTVTRLEWDAAQGTFVEVEDIPGTSGEAVVPKVRSDYKGPYLFRVKVALP